jgi:hypothetical protein
LLSLQQKCFLPRYTACIPALHKLQLTAPCKLAMFCVLWRAWVLVGASHCNGSRYLTINYRFDVDIKVKADRGRADPEDVLNRGLGFDQLEVFDMFQRHRFKIIKWLKVHPTDCNEVSSNSMPRISIATPTRRVHQRLHAIATPIPHVHAHRAAYTACARSRQACTTRQQGLEPNY